VKAIRTKVASIKKVEGNWRLIKWYESDGDLKSKRQMNKKTRWQNMNSNFEENQNVKQKLYESLNIGTCIADGWFYPHKYMCLEHIQI